MPTIPKRITLTNTSDVVLNTIRNHASINYSNYVPFAQPNADSIRQIGNVIMDYPELQNEFLSALVNRIAFVVIKSMNFENPWRRFKKGYLGLGESVEEVWVDIATPHEYSAEVAEEEVFKREIPDVRSAFHVMNWQKFYKRTIQRADLEKAFLAYSGVTDLANKIIQSMYTALYYDEFLTMRYLLARRILDNHFTYLSTAGAETGDNAKATLAAIRTLNNKLVFPSRMYNVAHVLNKSDISEQQLIISAKFESHVDVYALASAFNLNYADFMTKRILTPSFSFDPDELERLGLIFQYDTTYVGISPAENALLDKVYAVVVDDNYFMIFDKEIEMGDIRNVQGRYWNYDLHSWKLFSVSPFHTSVAIVDESIYNATATPDVTLVNFTTGEPIPATTTLALNVPYGIAIVPDTDSITGTQIASVEYIGDGGIEFTFENNVITFTSFGSSDTGADIDLTVTFTNGESTDVTFGVAP